MANNNYFPSAQNSSRQSLHGRAPSENTAPLPSGWYTGRGPPYHPDHAAATTDCPQPGPQLPDHLPTTSGQHPRRSQRSNQRTLTAADLAQIHPSHPMWAVAGAGASRSARRTRYRSGWSDDFRHLLDSHLLSALPPNNVLYGLANLALHGPTILPWQEGLGDTFVSRLQMEKEFQALVAINVASTGIPVAGSQPDYVDDPYHDLEWALIARESLAVLMSLSPDGTGEPTQRPGYSLERREISAAEAKGSDETSTEPGFDQVREVSASPVETSAGPAVQGLPVHEIVLPPKSPEFQEVDDVVHEPALAAPLEVPAVLLFGRDDLWAVNAHDSVPRLIASSAAVKSTSTFRTDSNLLRTNSSAQGHEASRPRAAPLTLISSEPTPSTSLPLHPEPHVDRLVLREQIRRERAVQPTSKPPMPQPCHNRPRLRIQTWKEQHKPAKSATFDDPSSSGYTSDENFMPRSARRLMNEQRLLSKSERLKESETPASPPATAEWASLGTSQEPSSEVRSGFQRRGPANPIRITSAKTGKEVDLARQRPESPTPTRARAGRPVYVSASELAVKNLNAACPTARHVHAARELLEEGVRHLDALGEEH
ncbi:hypothetical protein LTR15_009196 [Elasticomyces elasticus]|nr:hypothetical protein LTR15_009196 [Elasticomyces elasticus]